MSTFLWFVLASTLVTLLASPLRRWLVRRRMPRAFWLEATLRGALREHPPRRTLATLLKPAEASLSLTEVRALVDRAIVDPSVRGIVVRLGALSCGWSDAAEVRDALERARAHGRTVAVYLPAGGDTRSLYIAAAADRVFAGPQAALSPLGVATAVSFYRTLLSRGGVEAEVLARKEFKGAAEPFVRDALSEPNRLQLDALVNGLQREVTGALARGRGRDDAQAAGWFEGAPYLGHEAAANGLVDAAVYDDEIAPALGLAAPSELIEAGRYLTATAPGVIGRLRRARAKHVAVISLHGAIVEEAPFNTKRVIDAERAAALIRTARANPAVAAVVLHVDSRGGGAVASDRIAREVARLAERKPVVAAFGNAAASGGYYLAAPAHEIVSQPVTLTGSIGVVSLRVVLGGTLEKLGIHREVIKAAGRADMLSPYRRWSDEERSAMDRLIDGYYRAFLDVVARGRKMAPELVEARAGGRVYTGRDAHALGLVDHLGGLSLAIERARALANLPADAPAVPLKAPRRLPHPPEPPPVLEPIVSQLGPHIELLALLMGARTEQVFAFDDRLA